MRIERHREVQRLYDAGVSIATIAEVTGYSRPRVSRIVREYLALEWVEMCRAFDDSDEVDLIFEWIGTNERLSIVPNLG